jgi:hypothetical protein
MGDIEDLIKAAEQHGIQSGDEGHEIGDLQDIARFMWSQLPLVCKKRVMEYFNVLWDDEPADAYVGPEWKE